MNAVVHLQSTYSVSITTSYLFLRLAGGSVKVLINFSNYICTLGANWIYWPVFIR